MTNVKKIVLTAIGLIGGGYAISADDILAVELWANALPRKILGYRTPDGAFEAEMNAIYAA